MQQRMSAKHCQGCEGEGGGAWNSSTVRQSAMEERLAGDSAWKMAMSSSTCGHARAPAQRHITVCAGRPGSCMHGCLDAPSCGCLCAWAAGLHMTQQRKGPDQALAFSKRARFCTREASTMVRKVARSMAHSSPSVTACVV